MDATAERADFSYSDSPPVLIGATSAAAMARARRTVEASGCRVVEATDLGSACERFDRQVSASAIWIELDHNAETEMDRFLGSLTRIASKQRIGAVVSSSAELMDAAFAQIDDEAQLVVDADDAERAAALAMATARAGMRAALSDVASDRSAERLRQLSDEVSRIAATLARLSANPPIAPRAPQPPQSGAIPEVSVETVRAVIRARRLRSRYFHEQLFADPAWDMMLDLLQAEIAQLRVPVSSLCIAAAVPATTALRWLKTLVREELFVRRADPHDGRRVFVEMAPETSQGLRRYFGEIGNPAVI